MVLAYHLHTSHVNSDDGILDQKSQVLKMKDISCEGSACDEKNDHTHDHKNKRKKIPRIYSFNLA
jgi:hypothetical protein